MRGGVPHESEEGGPSNESEGKGGASLVVTHEGGPPLRRKGRGKKKSY